MRERALQCEDVPELLSRGELSTRVEDHLLACEKCAALVVRHLAEQEEPTRAEVDALLASVELEMDSSRGPMAWLRSLPTEVRWLAAAGVASLLLLLVTVLGRRPDLADVTCPTTAIAGIYGVLLAVAITRGLRAMHRREKDFVSRTLAWSLVALPAGVALASALLPVSHGVAEHDCFPIGLLVGTCMVGVLRVLDRSAHEDAAASLLAIAAAGLVANLALLLHCSDMRLAHVLPAHATVGLFLTLIYFGPRRRFQTQFRQR